MSHDASSHADELVLRVDEIVPPFDPRDLFAKAAGSRAPGLDLDRDTDLDLDTELDLPLEIELEIGCGKGRFLLAAAQRWPGRGFLAVEHARSLVLKVARRAARQSLGNVRLIQGDAKQLVRALRPASLTRVHVYCPDPWPKRRHAKHRLFAPPFAEELAAALAPGGELLFTSDHDPYFREVVARLAGSASFVRITPEEAFEGIPAGGFDAIFEEAGVPVFRGAWQRVREEWRDAGPEDCVAEG